MERMDTGASCHRQINRQINTQIYSRTSISISPVVSWSLDRVESGMGGWGGWVVGCVFGWVGGLEG